MEPILNFLYNSGNLDVPYAGVSGEDHGTWKNITLSGTNPDIIVFTGGGLNASLPTPTAFYGSREATLRPLTGEIPIPQTYIESYYDNIMYNVPLAGNNSNRYVFGVYVAGYIASDLYLEAWDDFNFATTSSVVLSGTTNYPYSMINAVRTTDNNPPTNWHGTTVSGGACLSGYSSRIGLKNSSSINNECVYFNIFVSLPYDTPLFHSTPAIGFRYLYI